MTTKQLLEILDKRGYIALSEYDQHRIGTVYDYNGNECGKCHYNTVERVLRARDRYFVKWAQYDDCAYIADYMCQKYQEYENRESCRRIADDLEEYARGSIYRCPECGEIIAEPDDHGDVFICPSCKTLCSFGISYTEPELEQLSVYDWLDDALDIEYRIGSDRQYRSAEVMVACGGPNIYVDTGTQKVRLHWWGNYAEYPASISACDELDAVLEDLFSCY